MQRRRSHPHCWSTRWGMVEVQVVSGVACLSRLCLSCFSHAVMVGVGVTPGVTPGVTLGETVEVTVGETLPLRLAVMMMGNHQLMMQLLLVISSWPLLDVHPMSF